MRKNKCMKMILSSVLSIVLCLAASCISFAADVPSDASIASVRSGSDSGNTRFSDTYYTDYIYVSNGTLTLNTTGSSSSSGVLGAYLYQGNNFLSGSLYDSVAIHRNGDTTMTWRNLPTGTYYIKFVSNGVSQTLSYTLYS